MALLRLLRFPNLIIVILTQYLLYYRLLRPSLLAEGVPPVLDHLHFGLLVLVTVLITAIGNILNDVIDYEIDLINRPHRVIIQRKISFSTAYWLAATLGLIGFFLSVYLSFFADRHHLLFLYPLAIIGLHSYNSFWKKRPLTGNLIIALYCAGAAAVIWIAEWPSLEILAVRQPESLVKARSVFLWFLVFAFLATAFRELVKDLEDVKGDKSANHRTLPLVWGERRSRGLALLLAGSLLLFLVCYGYLFRSQFGWPALAYMGVGIGAPLMIAMGALRQARSEEAYHQISQIAKFIILTGILLLLFIRN